jgi:hypothetical protein
MSSRPSGTNENISTYGNGTRDYTSAGTWESDTDNDLVTLTTTEVLECYADSASFTEQVTIAGATTDTTYFRIIRAHEDSFHFGSKSSGVVFTPDNGSNIVSVTESNFKVSDIAATGAFDSGSPRYVLSVGGTTTGVVVSNIYVYDITNSGAGTASGFTVISGTESIFVNCAVNNTDGDGILSSIATTGSLHMYNCSMRDIAVRAFRNGNSTAPNPILKNCLSADAGTADFFGTYAAGTEYNASSDATAPGTNSQTDQTFTFSGAGEILLASGDAGARELGVDLSGDGTFAFTDDFQAGTRPFGSSWDIGADEQGASGGVSVEPLLLLIRVGR